MLNILWWKKKKQEEEPEEEKKEEKPNAKEIEDQVAAYLADEKEDIRQKYAKLAVLCIVVLLLICLACKAKALALVISITTELCLIAFLRSDYDKKFQFEKAYLSAISDEKCVYDTVEITSRKKVMDTYHIQAGDNDYVCERMVYMESNVGDKIYVIQNEDERPFVVKVDRENANDVYKQNVKKEVSEKLCIGGLFSIGLGCIFMLFAFTIYEDGNVFKIKSANLTGEINLLVTCSVILLILGVSLIVLNVKKRGWVRNEKG